MQSTHIGIGVPGALGSEAIVSLATLAERLGYTSFWFNVVAPHADPVALLDAVMAGTERIEVGTGVVPLNGYPSATLASRLSGGPADDPRVIFGVGSGSGRRGALVRVIDGIRALRQALPRARIVIGGKGPRMVTIGATVADGLLLSMLSPSDATQITSHLAIASRHGSTTYAYHRVALDPGATGRVHAEMVSHGAWPRDADPPDSEQLIGTVLPTETDPHQVLAADLARYPADWVPVLRPLPARPDDLEDWRALFRLLAPG
jgi:alkanesulfonate monooxygenase SsuD/methylene tetrahydromethanopterin reductase-like flavin-dependent oxidoreductase (luciferase family)